MAFTTFDPRKTIRNKIGTDAMIGDKIEKCISVTADDGTTKKIPFYTREYVENKCPTMPYINMGLLGIPSVPHDISAAVREKRTLIDLDITYEDEDGIDVEDFGKKIADAIINLIRTYQSNTNGIWFYNVQNEGRLLIEHDCERVIFHWVMELEAINIDAC